MKSESISTPIIKGRGAVDRMAHRFEKDERQACDDGWDSLQTSASKAKEAPPLKTQIIWEDCKTVLTRNDSPDIPFEQAMNPYRGCEHGCIYCYARPTHSYLGLSPGLDFESQIIVKGNVVDVLRRELARPQYQPRMISVGSATDCYQPIERELRLTRQVIELLKSTRHPFAIITKSALIERDLDLLTELAKANLVAVYVSICTLEAELARKLEPRAAGPYRRLRVVRTLAAAGVPVGVSLAPQIPFITEDLEQVLQAAAEAGASSAFYNVLRLPWELAPLFQQWLSLHYPLRAERVMARVRDLRGGQVYDANFATRMKGQGIWAKLLQDRFRKTCARLGLNRERRELDCSQFVPPQLAPEHVDDSGSSLARAQGTLF
jgi:DNA repair photolyase